MTEVSHAWLDRVVTARQRITGIHQNRYHLTKLLRQGDPEFTNDYSDDAAEVLGRDGTDYRAAAIAERVMQLTVDLDAAIRAGTSIGGILNGLTELEDALEETILNTEALLAEVACAAEDPFVDRLEEHPAYERY